MKEEDRPKELGPAAVLSAANRANVRKKDKEGKQAGEAGSVTPSVADEPKAEESEKKEEDTAKEGGVKKEEEKKEEEEPDFLDLNNPSRVLPQQEAVVSWKEESRYLPVIEVSSDIKH